MAENKFLNKKTALVAGGLVAAYLLYKKSTEAKEGLPEGSLGGEDDLEGMQGFDIDPNNVIDDGYSPNESYFFVMPDGTIQPSPTPNTPEGAAPTNVPTYSSGSGSLVSDAAVLGGALGFNALLPSLGKGIKGAIDSKYAFKSTGDIAAESNFQKWIKDPYNVGESAVSKIMNKGEQGAMSVAQSGEKPIIREAGGQVLQTMPKWAKGVKGVANFIPLLDIPIGAGLDVYFSRYEEDPSKKIGWGDAFAANTAGELSQLGITGAAAAAGTVVPVAGNIAGGVGGFIVGTGADIAATEAYYKARGKSSLFDFGSSSAPQQNMSYAPNMSVAQTSQKAAQANLFSSIGAATVNPFSSGGSSSSSQNQSSSQNMSYANQSSSSGGGGSSSSKNMSVAPKTSSSSSAKSSSSVNMSKAPQTSSSVASKVGSAASAAKSAVTSTVSKVASAAKSAVSKVTSVFKSKKK
jgi:hypothetical protein